MTLDDLDEAQRAALVKRINRASLPDVRLRTCRVDTRAFFTLGRYYWHNVVRNTHPSLDVDPLREAVRLGVAVY